MSQPTWTLEDAKKHFFIYMRKSDQTDLLYGLSDWQGVLQPTLSQLAFTLYQSLQATALAASTPFYLAFAALQCGQQRSIRQLLELAPNDKGAFTSALALLTKANSTVSDSFEPLRLVHSNNIMPDAFQALIQQATAMIWGAFEAYCYDLYRILFTEKLSLLRAVAAAQANGTPWGAAPKQLADYIAAETTKAACVSAADAFDTYANKKLPSMNIRAIRFFAKVIFPSDAQLLALLNAAEVSKLAARRHLFLHAAGIVDQAYVADSGESLTIGTKLLVTPRELALAFRAISSASGALAKAASTAV
jgi:hypothetical protein